MTNFSNVSLGYFSRIVKLHMYFIPDNVGHPTVSDILIVCLIQSQGPKNSNISESTIGRNMKF